MCSPGSYCFSYPSCWVALCIVSFWSAGSTWAQAPETKDKLLTVAESSQFTATADGQQVSDYMRQLVHQWNAAELLTLGATTDGRAIEAVLIEPDLAVDRHPLTVLLLGGIHAGECDGKESLLAYMRDLAGDQQATWHRQLRIIFVPNFNADGDARRGKMHRPGQVGPEQGAGIRENALGLDLNRDFVKLESSEVAALVTALNRFDVDVLVDFHTTNGSLHGYQLTYDIPHHPAAPDSLDKYLRAELLPNVSQQLNQKKLRTFYYGNFDSAYRRWETYGYEPRYSVEYMGLRGKLGILVESYAYASYETRYLANYAFLDSLLHHLAEDQDRLLSMIQHQVGLNKAGTSVAIAGELAMSQDSVKVWGFRNTAGETPPQPYSAQQLSQYQAHQYDVQLWNRVRATRSVQMPAAYAIAPQFAWAVSRLQRHGITVQQLLQNTQVNTQAATIRTLVYGKPYQGHSQPQLTVDWQEQLRLLPAGSYIVPCTGPLARLVTNLLEPESAESLATWNFLDPYLTEGGEFPVVRLSSVPAQCIPVESIEPGERITLANSLQPGQSLVRPAVTPVNEIPIWLPSKHSPSFAQRQSGRWVKIDALSGATEPIAQIRQLESKLAELESFSSDEARQAAEASMFWQSDKTQTILSHKNDLYIYDWQLQVVRPLTHTPDQAESLAELSPDGRFVAYVNENNLWLINCQTHQAKQLTDDGCSDRLNGILDWVYQEELYGRGNFKGFWWNPTSDRLAYLQLDQSAVPEYLVSDSTSIPQSLERTRYPKAGQAIPKVRLMSVHVPSGTVKEIELTDFPAEDRLIGRVSWSPSNELWLQIFNRIQNRQRVVRVNLDTGQRQTVIDEHAENGWVEIRGTPQFLTEGQFLWLSDLPDGRTRLYRIDALSGQRSALTSGDWDVAELLGISDDKQVAFVSGNPGHSTDLHLIAVDLNSGSWRQITQGEGTHRVTIDSTGQFYIDTHSSLSSSPTTTLHSLDGYELRVLAAENSDRHQWLQLQKPRLEFIPARDGAKMPALVMLPYEASVANSHPMPGTNGEMREEKFNLSNSGAFSNSKLPVLFYVYGGPQAPTVYDQWLLSGRGNFNFFWYQALCNQGYAVVLCDNRSARGQGIADTWTIRGNLGRVELQDLEDAVAWVSGQEWADSKRIGIWGWSYGGYLTAYALTHSQLFKAGIAGAPVTDWRNYDAIYTERYMGLPQENQAGYQSSSVVAAADQIHGRLMIIHGEMDDNVHLSNTLQLADALQKAGKPFDLMLYPQTRHGVVDPAKRYQMYQMMTEFFERNLK